MDDDIYNWDPLSPEQVCELLAGLVVPWWIAGGWAIDLFVGRQTRPHADIDVLVRRGDQLEVQAYLAGWDLHKTKQPGLKPWLKAEYLKPGINDVWCRRTPQSPWSLQLMLLDTRGDAWVYRRDPAISGSLDSLGKRTASGIPYLSPEIQLLYKAKAEILDKDKADFEATVPLMSQQARSWLLRCLERRFPDGHEWITCLKKSAGHIGNPTSRRTLGAFRNGRL